MQYLPCDAEVRNITSEQGSCALIGAGEYAQVIIRVKGNSGIIVTADQIVRDPCQVLPMNRRLTNVNIMHEVKLVECRR